MLHICCAPCLIYPLMILRDTNVEITGFFFNPNIHPPTEYTRRREALFVYTEQERLRVIWGDYQPEDFILACSESPEERCRICYRLRLEKTARTALAHRCDGFTTTLLVSKFQKHDLIREIGESVAEALKIPFLYRDFRPGWQEGLLLCRERGIYRQNYCGCRFSEEERRMRLSQRS